MPRDRRRSGRARRWPARRRAAPSQSASVSAARRPIGDGPGIGSGRSRARRRARSSSPSGRRRRAAPGPRARSPRGPRGEPTAPGRAGAGRAARARASSARPSPATVASNRRSSAARLPVSVPRTASTITAASGEASSCIVRLRSPRLIVRVLPSTASFSWRGLSVSRTKLSGARNDSRPDDISVRSSISTRRVSTKVASPERTRPSSVGQRAEVERRRRGRQRAGEGQRRRRDQPGATCGPARRRGSARCGIGGRCIGIGPEVVEVEPVVRRLAAQALERRDVALERGADRQVASARRRCFGRRRRSRRSR